MKRVIDFHKQIFISQKRKIICCVCRSVVSSYFIITPYHIRRKIQLYHVFNFFLWYIVWNSSTSVGERMGEQIFASMSSFNISVIIYLGVLVPEYICVKHQILVQNCRVTRTIITLNKIYFDNKKER